VKTITVIGAKNNTVDCSVARIDLHRRRKRRRTKY
jgi:hypothetical protein